MRVVQAYRFALDPTPKQRRQLFSHAGAARVAYNWGLGRVRVNLAQRAAERSYGIADDQLTPMMGWSLPALRRDWNRAKHQVAPWWRQCSKEAFSTGLDALARALENWWRSRNGTRAGKAVGFPRSKSRRRTTPSVRFTTGAIRVELDRKHVVLPRLGRIKLHESARKLARRLEVGTARILSATVRYKAGRWYVAYTCEVKRAAMTPARPAAVVGVDVGVKHLAVLSTGELIPNPRHLAVASRRLRHLTRRLARRRGPDCRTGQQPSRRWEKTRAALGRSHHRVGNLRRDGLHKFTTRLASTYGTIVIEDLYLAGMLRNRRLARHLADTGLGELRRQLSYKTLWSGGRVVVAGRWFPSSKTCSGCGAVKAKLPLRVRTFICATCGQVMDRDLNAASNLAQLVTSGAAGPGVAGDLGSHGPKGRGANRKTHSDGQVATKRPPRTAHPAGKTGTVLPQGRTAGSELTSPH